MNGDLLGLKPVAGATLTSSGMSSTSNIAALMGQGILFPATSAVSSSPMPPTHTKSSSGNHHHDEATRKREVRLLKNR